MKSMERRYAIYFLQLLAVVLLSLHLFYTYPLNANQYIWFILSMILGVFGYFRSVNEALIASFLSVLGYGSYLLYELHVTEVIIEITWNDISWLFIFPIISLIGGLNERSVLAKQKAKEKEIEDFALDEISSNFQIPGFLDYADFLNRLEEEVYRGLQTRSKMTLLLIEIHHFQLIKHDYGSEQTKLILHKVADIISDLLRESEIKAYLGEGVYAVILPGAELIRASMIEIQLDDKFNSLLMPRSRRESTINVSMKYGKAESPTKGTEAHVIFGKAKKDLEGMEMSGS